MPIIESADAPATGQQYSVKHGIGKLRGNKALDFGRDYIPVPSKFSLDLVWKEDNDLILFKILRDTQCYHFIFNYFFYSTITIFKT